MNIELHLETLVEDPSNKEARRAVSDLATRRVGDALWNGSIEDRPDLSGIAAQILEENGVRLAPKIRAALLPLVRSIVDGVLDDDDATGVTELLHGEDGTVDEKRLYEVLKVALGKRLRWTLNRPQFNSLKHSVSPGALMTELFLRFHQSGLPRSLQNRYDFFHYCEKVLKNLLADMNRANRRIKRGSGDVQSLEELLGVLENKAESGALSAGALLDLYVAVDKLPEDLGKAIRLHYLWGMTLEEVSEELKVSRTTVVRLLSKGLTTLKGILNQTNFLPPTPTKE